MTSRTPEMIFELYDLSHFYLGFKIKFHSSLFFSFFLLLFLSWQTRAKDFFQLIDHVGIGNRTSGFVIVDHALLFVALHGELLLSESFGLTGFHQGDFEVQGDSRDF
jgi:hypothetical protein